MLPDDPGRGGGPVLLERDGELDHLQRVVDAAANGKGEMLVVVGPAGIGKSSLLARARREAGKREVRLVTASGSMMERGFPFGVCRQLFEPALTSASESERETLLDGAAAVAGRLLLAAPTSGGQDGNGSGLSPALERLPGEPGSTDVYARLHGLYWLAANLAEQRPLLIAVDDAHWADVPSLRLLNYLARRLDGLPISAVVAAREAEPGAKEDLLRSVLDVPEVRVLRPASLSELASAALIRQALGAEPADDFAACCRQATGGNPFYLAELLRALASSGVAPTSDNTRRVTGIGPPAISREVLGRVAHLGRGCAALVRALAVLGGTADLSVAAELAGLDEIAASAAADALFRAAILAGGVTPRFSHPIMQAAIYEDIPPLERAGAHRRAAALLADRSAGDSEVAVHLLHTRPGRDHWTRARVRGAAERALAEADSRAAIDYLRRGLAESPTATERFELLRSLGQTLAGQGDPLGIEVMRASAEGAPDSIARAKVAIPFASALVFVGRAGEAAEALETALTELGEATDAGPLATQLEALLLVMGITDLDARRHLRQRLGRTVERFRRAPGSIPESVLPPLAIELINAGAPATQVAGIAERALDTGELLRRALPYSPLPYVAAYVLIATGRTRLAERKLDEAAERAIREGAGVSLGVVSVARSLARLRRGDLRGAQTDAELYVRLSTEQQGPEVFSPIAYSTLATVHLERGELAQARAALTSPVTAAFDPNGVLTQPLVESRARLHLVEGDYAGGVREIQRCREWAEAWGEGSGSWPVQWRSTMALGELGRGEVSRARELAREDVELARRFGVARSLGRSLMALGLGEGGDRGIATLRAAVQALQESEDRLEHARAQVELGAALRRRGERAAAREPLAVGMKMGRSCGATALAERAYEELRAAGARPQKILYSGLEALTASELRVARMAAEGRTNREVAQSLFVTQKTVEVHLSHAYQKLGITSRSALPAALAADPAERR